MQFTILDSSNTARVTLSDPRPNHWHSQTVDTLADVRTIAHTVACYAARRGISARDVQISTVYPVKEVA
jgi:hypothetical protein